jgi:hypothetical protein
MALAALLPAQHHVVLQALLLLRCEFAQPVLNPVCQRCKHQHHALPQALLL